MGHGTWLENTLAEGWTDATPVLVVALVVAAAIRSRAARRLRSRASMRGTAILLLLHVASLPWLGWLAAQGDPSYGAWRVASLTIAALAGITILLAVVFDGALRWLRVDLPRIAQDTIAGALYLVGLFVLLSRMGVNLSGLIATSAVLTAVIGFSLQDTLGNLMGGMALQLEKSIQPGDWIKVNDQVGQVLEVRWRQTTIETRNWETLVVPNSFLVKNSFMILGRRQGEPLQWRRLIPFHVDYRYSPTQVIGTVEEAVRRAPIPGVASEPPANCVLMDMRDSFHTYTLRYWLTDLSRDDPTDSLVRTRLFFALKRAGIPLTMPAHAIFVTNESEDRRTRKAHDLDQAREKVLREAELFRSLTPDEVDELAEGLRFSPFSAGEVLTTQGSVGHDLYLIHQGKVSIRVTAGGVDTEVAQLGPGSFFGERSLMTGEKRSATTVALTDVVSYRLAKEQLESILKRRPELAEQVAAILARRAHELDARRKDLTDAARERAIEQDSHQFVTRIKHFFGL